MHFRGSRHWLYRCQQWYCACCNGLKPGLALRLQVAYFEVPYLFHILYCSDFIQQHVAASTRCPRVHTAATGHWNHKKEFHGALLTLALDYWLNGYWNSLCSTLYGLLSKLLSGRGLSKCPCMAAAGTGQGKLKGYGRGPCPAPHDYADGKFNRS